MNLFNASHQNKMYRLDGILSEQNRIYPRDHFWKLDSNEEKHFVWWLQEMRSLGFVEDLFQIKPIELIPPCKIPHYNSATERKKTISLAQSLTYNPDFIIMWTDKAKRFVTHPAFDISHVSPFYHSYIHSTNPHQYFSIVDVKPSGFGKHIASSRDFPIKQKLMLAMGLYVQKIMLYPGRKQVEKIQKMKKPFNQMAKYLFWQTFTPNEYLFTEKTRSPRKIHYNVYNSNHWLRQYQLYENDSYAAHYAKIKTVHTKSNNS